MTLTEEVCHLGPADLLPLSLRRLGTEGRPHPKQGPKILYLKMTPLVGKGQGPFAVVEAGRIRVEDGRASAQRWKPLGDSLLGPILLAVEFDAVSRPGRGQAQIP